MADEDYDSLEEILDDAKRTLALSLKTGVESMTHGDRTVRELNPLDRAKALRELELQQATVNDSFGLRLTTLVPPGCG